MLHQFVLQLKCKETPCFNVGAFYILHWRQISCCSWALFFDRLKHKYASPGGQEAFKGGFVREYYFLNLVWNPTWVPKWDRPSSTFLPCHPLPLAEATPTGKCPKTSLAIVGWVAWSSLGLVGCAWVCSNLLAFSWVYLGLLVFAEVCLGLLSFARVCLRLLGVAQVCSWFAWVYLVCLGLLWFA